jgi:hypothetical protein
MSGGEDTHRKRHTEQKMGCDCTDVQPAAIPCGDWDIQRRVLKAKGIGKQAEKVSVEVSGGRTGDRQT